MRFRTGHNRLNSHMHRKLKLAPSPTCPCGREEQTTEHVLQRCPPLQSYKRRRVACQHFPDDQTLRLQAGAGEDDIIHLPSGLDCVDCERQEEEEEEDASGCGCVTGAPGHQRSRGRLAASRVSTEYRCSYLLLWSS